MRRKLALFIVLVGTALASSLVVLVGRPVAAQSASAVPPASVANLGPKPFRTLYTKPNEGYLYTGSWAEFSAGQNQHRLTSPSARPLGYIFTQASTETQPIYRLKKKGANAWLYTPSVKERDALTIGSFPSFAYEGVSGHLFKTKQPNTEPLYRYSNGKGWRLAFASEYDAPNSPMKTAGYKLDGPMGYMLKEYYKVGAYYFGMFNQEGSKHLRTGVRALYGRDDWWGGVKDFYGQELGIAQNTRGWTGDFSHLKPTIGYYDNSKPEVLEQHIHQAASHGLEYFNFYWYWHNLEKRPTIDGGLKAYLQAANRSKLQFTISPCFHKSGTNWLSLERADFQRVADAISNVVAEPGFLTTQSGRPLMFMCDTRGIDNGNIQSANEFVTTLKQTVKQKTGKDLFVMQHSEYGTEYVSQLSGDGLTCLNHSKSIISGNYQSYVIDIPHYFAHYDAQRPTMRCITTDFDEKVRTDIALPKSSIRYYNDRTHELYRQALYATKNSMQAAPASEIDNYAVSFAFNEWHEGSMLEPNMRDGGLTIRELQGIFDLQPR